MNPFDYVAPKPESVEEITKVREACKALHELLLTLKYSRERALAITKLEEVSMWANKSIVFTQDLPKGVGALGSISGPVQMKLPFDGPAAGVTAQ